jgi:hypothetical protein
VSYTREIIEGASLAGLESPAADLALGAAALMGDVNHGLLLSSGLGAQPPLAPTACYLGGKCVQMGGPERAEVVEPVVHVAQWLRIDGVKPTGALGTHGCEPGLAEDAEVLGHGGLGDPEL